MPARRFNEADIDFDAIDSELAKLVPPKLSLLDVLDRLRKRLVEQQAKGVTVAQMHEVLKSGGIDITERSLRTFLTKGVLPGRRLPRLPGPWCRKKAVIRSDPNDGAHGFAVVVFGMWIVKLRWGMAGLQRGASAAAYGDGAKRRADRRRCIVRRTASRQRA